MNKLRLRKSDLDWVKTDHEAVILDGKAEQYLATNPTGAILWSALSDGSTEAELVSLLCGTFDDLDETKAREDVAAYLARLRELDLLEES